MIKPLLLAGPVAVFVSGAAFAADLPRRAAPPVFTTVPVFSWTGFYAGLNAGYGFDAGSGTSGSTVVTTSAASGLIANGGAPGVATFSNDRANNGFSGGGQIGYNYQFTPGSGFVIGVEVDAQYLGFGANRNTASFAGTPNADLTFVNPNGLSNLDYFGTVRGRFGYAFDRTLVYGTGGFAYGGGGGSSFGLPNSTSDSFRTGWAAGGGIEYALPTDSFLNFFRSSAVTVKVEGLYVSLDRNSTNGAFAYSNSTGTVYNVSGTGYASTTGYTSRRSDEFAVVRAGLNYKFGTY
jgi:outer membrane immunogenic protein